LPSRPFAKCAASLIGWSGNPASDQRKAVSFARRAIEVAGNDPAVLANAAYTLEAFGEDLSAMTALVDRALTLNPSYARGWYISAWMRLSAGYPDLAIEQIETSLRLNPREYVGVPTLVTSWAHFLGRRFDVAAQHFRMAMRQVPGSPWPYRGLAACLAHLGQLADAREAIRELEGIDDAGTPNQMRTANPELDELLLSGLRLVMPKPFMNHK
jgi:tetratricopeptide (TPR) repeat protein